ncbi:PH domain-containing protein [Acidiferrimicrobium sp. IK]|uniref:PH domain-containing protein n=1 Tax=Acidiferrimicrobium sp. IK TaxID=2871700 RepID=UPI0021CB2A7C|nr:PH domain-containing protein [Acidiferrimicrobium sp. IK]MCU4187361.1 PH domain-containing protein [Acidiferrimicrobium sp. IK]
MLYDDGRIACDESRLVVRRYYPWGGAKSIPYASIRSVTRSPLTGLTGKWRIWGSSDFVHWSRYAGRRVLPTITPDDPDTVARILAEHSTS